MLVPKGILCGGGVIMSSIPRRYDPIAFYVALEKCLMASLIDAYSAMLKFCD